MNAGREVVFAEIYRQRVWGSGESASGPGSGLLRTAGLRAALGDLTGRLRPGTLLDAGCGDFHWIEETQLQVDVYVGVDIVRELIDENRRRHGSRHRQFVRADIVQDQLPRADLVLCRECLMHFSNDDALQAIANLRRVGASHLLATTFMAHDNADIRTGGWRPLNLQEPPFSFPPPLEAIHDAPINKADRERYADKRLALWRFADLP